MNRAGQWVMAVAVGSIAAMAILWAARAPQLAEAQELTAPPPARWSCRIFPGDPDKDRLLRTDDGTTEVGQWVREQETAGWRVVSVDFEVGQKATGYPQAWTQVCMSPAL